MSANKWTPKEYEHLGRLLVSVYETGYIGRKELYKMSFVKGIFTGLGSVVGATIVIALLLWVISLFDRIPLLNRFIDTKQIQQTVQPLE